MPSAAFSPEADLLLCCARTRMEAGALERMERLLRREIRWPYLMELAGWHRQDPLLHRHVVAHARNRVPTSFLDALCRRALHSTGRSMMLAGELLKILDAFAARQIEVVPYKGPVLAVMAFGEIGLRPCYDLDLLVREEHLGAAMAVLQTLSYRTSEKPGDDLPATKSQLALTHEGHGHVVELHWRLAPPRLAYDFDLEGMRERLEPVSFCGRQVLTFGSEDLLVLLTTHGAKHFWRRLHWLCSVAELLRAHPELDGEAVRRRAAAVGAERALQLGLCLAADLLDAQLPPSLIGRPSSRVRALQSQVGRWLFFEPGCVPEALDPPEPLRRAWFQLGVRESLQHGLRYSLHRLRQMARPKMRCRE